MGGITPDDGHRLINGRYRLVELLGRGGMGTVWRGHDEMLDREVAIKEVTLSPDLDDDERAELTTLALQEARATAVAEIGAAALEAETADGVAFSPDGKTLAVPDAEDESLQLWSIASHRMTAELDVSPMLSGPAFSPDGRTLAVPSHDSLTSEDTIDISKPPGHEKATTLRRIDTPKALALSRVRTSGSRPGPSDLFRPGLSWFSPGLSRRPGRW